MRTHMNSLDLHLEKPSPHNGGSEMRKSPIFLFLIILLASLMEAPNNYSVTDPLPQNLSPIYNISTTLLYWNGTGYLPVITPGTGDVILASVGYKALITNVAVLNENEKECTIRVDYIITKVHGVDVPINKTLSKTFVVDLKTNSFILNGTTAFFPFYVCNDNLKYTYHFNDRINVKKSADVMEWKNVTYGGNVASVEFGPIHSAVGKEVMGYLCSTVDLEEKKCIKFDPHPEPILDVDFSSHYMVGIYGTFPGDPLGILNGPVELVGNVVKSERTAKLLGAKPATPRDDPSQEYAVVGIILLTVGVIAVWRARK